jgi:hypothetical protein
MTALTGKSGCIDLIWLYLLELKRSPAVFVPAAGIDVWTVVPSLHSLNRRKLSAPSAGRIAEQVDVVGVYRIAIPQSAFGNPVFPSTGGR